MGITPQDARKMMDAYNKVYAPKEEPAVETPEVETAPPETEITSEQ
tara:strand:+ start:181 stop:318 length:138 start_codon:yes stop_codon:yes gene_type:complete